MSNCFNPLLNFEKTKKSIGYVSRKKATPALYKKLGFRCGLEIHQQLKTRKKLFCRCPARIYQKKNDYDAEIVRHMRPTLSELGEYDGTALMEFKTRKNIMYRIQNETCCTYDIDDTPPFPLNREALGIAMEVALLLKTSIVGELHITRKQYLDGSIPTGFQRTAILGIEGKIPLSKKNVRIIQLSIEEDACREVSDIGHERIYTTDRLGIPLIETVTYPDMETPGEAAEAAHYIRFLTRSTGKMNTGIGAAREDVNVSIAGGSRVEIKGVAHIRWIPELTHNEAFRQKALLEIKKILCTRFPDPSQWKIHHQILDVDFFQSKYPILKKKVSSKNRLVAVNLPGFGGILSFFTQPGRSFADEISDRLKVIACLEKPNMVHSESLESILKNEDVQTLQKLLKSGENDAQLILWAPDEDIQTALETVEERCCLAFKGVPNETRKSLPDGTTLFERVLPGPDRMYPDTDSAPIPITEDMIAKAQKNLPSDVSKRIQKMKSWKIPEDTYTYIFKRNLFPMMEKIIEDFHQEPSFVGTLLGHTLKNSEGKYSTYSKLKAETIIDLFVFVQKKKLKRDILKEMLPAVCQHPNKDFNSIAKDIGYRARSEEEILSRIPELKKKYRKIKTSKDGKSEGSWMMGQLRPLALGNMDLEALRKAVDGGRK